MSITPLSGGLWSSLLGVGATRPGRTDPFKLGADELRYPKESGRSSTEDLRYAIIIIVISAIIFITVVAMYDVVRTVVANYFAATTIANSNQETAAADLLSNSNALIAGIIFAFVCVITVLIFVPLLSLLL